MAATVRMRRLLPWLCALVFALFHVLTVVWTLLATHGSGEGQAFLVAILDLPLMALLQVVPGGSYVLYNSTTAYIAFFAVAGTLMYAAAGYLFGVLLRALLALIFIPD